MESLKQVSRATFPAWRSPHEAGRPILDVADLTVRYGTVVALQDISFQLRQGERVAVVGPNGAGKSTLLKAIAGIIRPMAGTIRVGGHPPDDHVCIAYVPQRTQVDLTFPVTVSDVVMMGRIGKLGLLRWPRAADRALVNETLELVGMADLSNRQIGELSGGQQQRVFIARALAQEAELMLMDEPLTGLDVASQEAIFDILDGLRDRGVTVMLTTHDLNQAAQRFDRVMLINRHVLAFGSPEEVFTAELLTRAYGGHLHLVPTQDGLLVLGDTCCEGD